jgi:hypothetical protein
MVPPPPWTDFGSAPCNFLSLLAFARWPGGGRRPSWCAFATSGWPTQSPGAARCRVVVRRGAGDCPFEKMRHFKGLNANLYSFATVLDGAA